MTPVLRAVTLPVPRRDPTGLNLCLIPWLLGANLTPPRGLGAGRVCRAPALALLVAVQPLVGGGSCMDAPTPSCPGPFPPDSRHAKCSLRGASAWTWPIGGLPPRDPNTAWEPTVQPTTSALGQTRRGLGGEAEGGQVTRQRLAVKMGPGQPMGLPRSPLPGAPPALWSRGPYPPGNRPHGRLPAIGG